MVAYIKSFRGQDYLVPPRLTDLFEKDHVCYLVESLVDGLDFSDFDERYSGVGHPAYHPRIMLKLLIMASVDSIRSSRRIAKSAQQDVVYIFLAEKTQPDFRTISDFRKDNKELVKRVFLQINRFALERGLIDLSHLMVDGTTIKANANDDKNIDLKTIEKLEKYIDELIEEGIKVDEEEDEVYGERGMHQLPESLNTGEKRKRIVQEIVKEINNQNKTGREEIKENLHDLKQEIKNNGINKYSFTDPDSRFMLNKKGKIELSYNAQLVTDKNGMIVSNTVVQDCHDRHQLLPNIQQVEKSYGSLPTGTIITTDGLYLSPDITKLSKFDLYMPTYGMQKLTKNKFDKINFDYSEEKDIYICPMSKILEMKSITKDKTYGQILNYRCNDCKSCPHKKECCKDKSFRTITAFPHTKIVNRIKKKMQSPKGKKIYSLRKQTVELSFADIKHNKKFRNFLLRGIEKTKIEFNLACIAHNLVKINNKLRKNKRNQIIAS
jgi:transposase